MGFLVRLYLCRWITVPQLVNAFYVITKNEIGELNFSMQEHRHLFQCLIFWTRSAHALIFPHDEETMTTGL